MPIIRPVLPDELEDLGRLRYEIYVAEMGRKQFDADRARRTIIDSLDHSAVNLVAEHRGEFIGTVRLNLHRNGGLGAYQDFYEIDSAHEDMETTSMSTRFMVLPQHRGTRLPLQLATALYEYGLEVGVTSNHMDCNAHLLPFFTRLGYRHRLSKRHAEYGDVDCLRLQIRDHEHLAEVRSPFLSSYRKYLSRNTRGCVAGKESAPIPL